MPIGLGIGLNISMRGGLASGFSLDAPVLAFASATDPDSDATQDLDATFSEDIEGHWIRLVGTFGSATVSEPYDIDVSEEIDSTEAGALAENFTTGYIINGVCSLKCRIQSASGSGGTAESDWSNTVSKTIAAASLLSSPTDIEIDETTGSGTVTINQAGGTLYWVLSSSATSPTVTQIKAGQDHTGGAAEKSGSQAVSTSGVQNVSFTTLTASTTYYAHYGHENAAVQQSNVASADGFTTDAASGVAPANTVAPAVTGGAWLYGLLTTTDGTWDGSPSGYTYQWQNAGVDIGGATSNTYTLTTGDIGDNITCIVTATNAFGSTPQVSNTIAVAAAGTNLLSKTEVFDNAFWTKSAVTVGANEVAAPDGATTADDIRENNANSKHEIFQASNTTISNATQYTFSIFVKPNERTIVYVNFAVNGAARTWFDLTGAGAVLTNAVGTTATIQAIANGWYRISVRRTSTATTANCGIALTDNNDNVQTYTGVTGSGAWWWGAQLEQAAAMTSYSAVA